MVLKNIIINKTAIIKNDNQLVIDDIILSKIKKLSDLNSKLVGFESTIDYEKIINLDLYNQISRNKFTLYQPTEYNGWLILLDVISYKIPDKELTPELKKLLKFHGV
jgi:hypothetical protein